MCLTEGPTLTPSDMTKLSWSWRKGLCGLPNDFGRQFVATG